MYTISGHEATIKQLVTGTLDHILRRNQFWKELNVYTFALINISRASTLLHYNSPSPMTSSRYLPPGPARGTYNWFPWLRSLTRAGTFYTQFLLWKHHSSSSSSLSFLSLCSLLREPALPDIPGRCLTSHIFPLPIKEFPNCPNLRPLLPPNSTIPRIYLCFLELLFFQLCIFRFPELSLKAFTTIRHIYFAFFFCQMWS